MDLLFLFTLSSIDIVFFVIFGVLLLIILVFFIFDKITTKKTEKEIRNEFERLKNSKEEEKVIESVVSETSEPEKEEVEELVVVEEEPVADTVKEEISEVLEEANEVTTENVIEEIAEPVAVEEVTEEPEEKVATPVQEEIVEKPRGRQYNGKYEVYAENDYYRYRLKASNGEVLFVSEMYASRDTVLKSIDAVKRNLEKGKTLIIVDKKKNWKFKLVAANHRVLAISANYSTEKGAQNALESFRRFALTDDIVEIEIPADSLDGSLVEANKTKEEDKKGGKFVLKKDINGEFSWEFKANNGEILCQQSGYSSRAGLDTAIVSFKNAIKNGKFYISKDKNDLYQFRLYGESGRLFAVGESYDASNFVQSAIISVVNFIDLATVSDRTVQKPASKKPAKKVSK